MFSNRRRLRRWAAQVLLVWLFGFAMSVANACALGESTRHADGVNATADIAVSHHQGDPDGDTGQANCLDFCEKSSVGVPKLQLTDDSPAAAGFAVPASVQIGVIRLSDFGAHRLLVDASLPRGSPPLRIVYQRLAL